MLTCIVCGMGVSRSGLEDHRDATHPEIKKSILLSDLFRPHDDPRKATP